MFAILQLFGNPKNKNYVPKSQLDEHNNKRHRTDAHPIALESSNQAKDTRFPIGFTVPVEKSLVENQYRGSHKRGHKKKEYSSDSFKEKPKKKKFYKSFKGAQPIHRLLG